MYSRTASKPLQTNNKQNKIVVTFRTGYNGNFNITNSNKKFYFKRTITDGDDFFFKSVYHLELMKMKV